MKFYQFLTYLHRQYIKVRRTLQRAVNNSLVAMKKTFAFVSNNSRNITIHVSSFSNPPDAIALQQLIVLLASFIVSDMTFNHAWTPSYVANIFSSFSLITILWKIYQADVTLPSNKLWHMISEETLYINIAQPDMTLSKNTMYSHVLKPGTSTVFLENRHALSH